MKGRCRLFHVVSRFSEQISANRPDGIKMPRLSSRAETEVRLWRKNMFCFIGLMEEKEVDLKQRSAAVPSFKKGQDSWTHEILRPLQWPSAAKIWCSTCSCSSCLAGEQLKHQCSEFGQSNGVGSLLYLHEKWKQPPLQACRLTY